MALVLLKTLFPQISHVRLNSGDPKFWIFPYKIAKSRKNDPSLTRHISATVLGVERIESEPILETSWNEKNSKF